MIGYIKTYPPDLKMKEYVKYNAYYCGICHSIKDRWGQIPRLTLNYDCVFFSSIYRFIVEDSNGI